MKEIFSRSKWIIGFIIGFLVLGIGNNKALSGGLPGGVGAEVKEVAEEEARDIKAEEEASDIKAVMEELNKLRQKVDEVDGLKQRIGVLEKKVSEQEKIIKQQKEALEKVGEIVPAVKEALLPPEPKVLVKNFVLNGVNLFTAKDFEPILDKYRGKELGLSDLKKIADKITAFYRSKGYITSLAYAPAQEITGNSVEFSVIEGRVGDIKVEEGKYYKKETIERKFLVEKGEILDYEKLEKSVKRINKQPDRTVKAVLLPGEESGTSDILLKVEKERSPRHLYLEYNNRGTAYTGKNRFGIGFVDNDLLGRDDILSCKLRVGENYDEVYAASLDYNFPISRYDTRLGFYGVYSHADIGGQFAIITPEGKAAAYGAYLTHLLFDKNFSDPIALNLVTNVTLGFDSVSVWNKILGKETSHDELRIAKAGITFDEKDSMGRTFMSNEIRVGIADFLGSMDEHDVSATRLDAGGEFVKYVGSLNRVTRLPFSSLLIGSIKGQCTDKPLVNSEQLAFGGADSIRGFPENDYLADYGWISTFELRTPAFIFPRLLKVPFDKKGISLKEAIQFAYFVDFGKGYLKKPRVGEKSDRLLIGMGFGLRFEFTERFRGRVDWGFPVGNEEPSDGSTNTVHFGFQYDLW